MSIQICNTTRKKLPVSSLQKAVQVVIEGEGCSVVAVTAVYCGDRLSRRINKEYLGHDYSTDTITFALGEGPGIEGEFYIAIPVVAANAVRFNVDFFQELMRVTIHSVLHLAGYLDGTDDERRSMRKKEDYYLACLPADTFEVL